jgi:hypothetical protein
MVGCTLQNPYSSNQSQGRVLTLRECAQSIPRQEKLIEDLFLCEISKFCSFSFQYTYPPSLNQGRESIFTLLECTQSILHIGKLLKNLFSCEILFIFVLIHISPFPESGSGKHFHAARMRAIDSPHKITPIGIKF